MFEKYTRKFRGATPAGNSNYKKSLTESFEATFIKMQCLGFHCISSAVLRTQLQTKNPKASQKKEAAAHTLHPVQKCLLLSNSNKEQRQTEIRRAEEPKSAWASDLAGFQIRMKILLPSAIQTTQRV
ncbi:hypothetical protein AVEN_30573-1 [Araneus ventricosus]|uniref:Uncharacterized protein n=1 Tax=Araneus ventricosus TaxID=182803 RepID=A0A4Y2ERV2_ARAVE|nr:hypothetical protein AVEN_30573-1 [Araneus ventricosus]